LAGVLGAQGSPAVARTPTRSVKRRSSRWSAGRYTLPFPASAALGIRARAPFAWRSSAHRSNLASEAGAQLIEESRDMLSYGALGPTLSTRDAIMLPRVGVRQEVSGTRARSVVLAYGPR